jgi:hypothetical protein
MNTSGKLFQMFKGNSPAAAAAAAPIQNASASIFGGFSNFWFIMLIVLIIFICLVVYYKTIGYKLDIGWRRIYELIRGQESVSVDIADGALSGSLTPMTIPSNELPSGLPGASENDGLLSDISKLVPARKEVFNVSKNIYKYSDASAVCSALGAELATYEQVKDAYESGADWCNYGWTKGQMALYPTQKSTWDKLQSGPAEYNNACGRIGVNGGYFDNPELAFGVNCYGVKPSKNATDELMEAQIALPPTAEEIEFDKRVQKFRDQLNTTTVLPFHRGQWSSGGL